MAALSRMAADVHKKVTIMPGDTIIFSSNPIPGNEKSVSKVINELTAKGANVIFQDAHVSGHACQEICNSGPWRVQTSESKCRNRQDAWYSERKYLYSEIG